MALIKNLPSRTSEDIQDEDLFIIEDSNYTCQISFSELYDKFKSNMLEALYPIGSIYMSANNVSPSNFLGGVEFHRGLGFNCLC